MNVYVFGEMSLLAETFRTKATMEWFFAGMGTYVNVHRVLVLEALLTKWTEVKQTATGGRHVTIDRTAFCRLFLTLG